MSAAAAVPDRRRPLVLRNHDFGKAWASQVLTQAGARMFQVGASWQLVGHAAGGDGSLSAGLLMAVSTVPAVALAPLIARAVARSSPRSLLRAAAAGATATAALLTVWAATGDLPLGALYAAALALTTCQAFFDPCLTTSVPVLVDDADVEAATGFELSTQSLAGLGGALLGALVVDLAGLAGLAAVCMTAYGTAATLLTTVRFRTTAADGPAADGLDAGARRTLRQTLAALPRVRAILLCFAAANLFTTAVFVVMPLYTATVLHGDGATVSLLEASLGAGTLVGSFTGARVLGRPTVAGAACLGVMGAALALPGFVAALPAIAGALLVTGWCVGAIGVRFVALFQRLVPAADKPAFFAVMQAVLGATFPVASLLFGLLGDHLSARTLCLIQAAGLAPAALALFLLPVGSRRARGGTAPAPTGPAPVTEPPEVPAPAAQPSSHPAAEPAHLPGAEPGYFPTAGRP